MSEPTGPTSLNLHACLLCQVTLFSSLAGLPFNLFVPVFHICMNENSAQKYAHNMPVFQSTEKLITLIRLCPLTSCGVKT